MFSLLNKEELNQFFNRDEILILAVSTGIDSMCLFHYLYNNGYNIVVAHVNHQKRVESIKEYEYLEKYCAEIGVKFVGYTMPKIESGNFQEEARRLRYEFLVKTAKEYGSNKIITAHQADDLVETILMRLTRGSSIKGYSGINKISKIDDIYLIRPMLDVSRDEIIKYQKENNITFFNDSSNDSNLYTRNKIRHEVTPTLKDINQNLYSSFKNFSVDIMEISEHLTKEANSFISKYAKKEGKEISFKQKDFNKLDDIIKQEVIILSVNYISNNTLEITHKKIKEIANFRDNLTETKTIELGRDYKVSFEYQMMIFYKEELRPIVNLKIYEEGTYELGNGIRVVLSQNYHLLPKKNSYLLCYNNTDKIYPICVRNVMNGDKITNHNITKKVSKILVDNKIPKRKRKNILVVENNSGIFFIPNILRKETDKSLKNKLYITFEGEL